MLFDNESLFNIFIVSSIPLPVDIYSISHPLAIISPIILKFTNNAFMKL